jgi:LPS sulfotransferase NodH
MDEKRFANLVKDIVIDPRVAAQTISNIAAADRCILVLFTPRSGSSWLTKIVSSTKCLGNLEEYINPDFVRGVAKQLHATHQATLLAMLKRLSKSQNGVFSMEARALDIELFGEPEFFAALGPRTEVFYLWRGSIVAQGISLYRAVATKRFHSTEAPVPPPAYDPQQIAEWTGHVLGIENDNLKLLERRGLHARFLRYEDIVQDRAATLRILADAVRVDLTQAQLDASRVSELQKLADEWNSNAEQRFREERPDFIKEIEAQRLIRRDP